MRAIDGFLERVLPRRFPEERPLRKILLANTRHLGDVVISTSLLPVLKAALPDVELGMLVGSWSRQVVTGHPMLAHVHTLDHWKLNRGEMPRVDKVRQYVRTRRRALKEMREVGYDAAIELCGHFPNSIPLLRAARIPVRVGYESGGFGPMLTHALPWVDSDRQVGEYQLDLLRAMHIGVRGDLRLRSVLPPVAADTFSSTRELLGGGDDPYVVVHMGSGSELKEWPTPSWRRLAAELGRRGHRLVFTGHGERERRLSEEVAECAPRALNLTGALSWDGFVAVLHGSRLVICVDSAAGHVAAAGGTPCVVLMAGLDNPHQWRPLGEAVWPIMNRMPCTPCYRSAGCAGMDCIRGITVEGVLATVDAALAVEAQSDGQSAVRSGFQIRHGSV